MHDNKTLAVTKAVKCCNGTFIGKETDELIIWKGMMSWAERLGNGSSKRVC